MTGKRILSGILSQLLKNSGKKKGFWLDHLTFDCVIGGLGDKLAVDLDAKLEVELVVQ